MMKSVTKEKVSVLHGGVFADNLFCRNLHEARRTNEYVQP